MRHSIMKYVRPLAFFALKVLVGLAVTFAVAGTVVYTGVLPCIPTQRIVVQETKLWVCIADTQFTQTRGLSYTRYLPRGWGMLFVFDDYSRHQFWMKDMNYAIDILWLDDDLSPTEVARNASPDTYPGLFTPVFANRFVLETRPGVVDGDFPVVPLVNK